MDMEKDRVVNSRTRAVTSDSDADVRHPAEGAADSASRASQPRWHLLYFVLAGFDLVTVSLSLYLGHRLMHIYRESATTNQEWVERSNRYSELGQLAAAVNAPGNDVYDTRDVEGESARLRDALLRFNRKLEAAHDDVDRMRDSNEPLAKEFSTSLREVAVVMDQMVVAASTIFSHFEHGEPDKAGAYMATMDRKYAGVSSVLARLRERVGSEQSRHLAEQLAVGEALHKFEAFIAGAIVLMVGGITVYGHKLSKSVRAAARDTEWHLAEAEEARRRAEKARTELEDAQQQLLRTSRQAGMAEIATGVLHNVGNVLNSVNIAASVVAEKVRRSKVDNLTKTAELMQHRGSDIAVFLTDDERGRRLPGYLTRLARHLTEERDVILEELRSLSQKVDHVKQIVATQQSYAGTSGIVEEVCLTDLAEDALKFHVAAFGRLGIEVTRDYRTAPRMMVDRHKLLQILINLLSNAQYAMQEARRDHNRLILRIDMCVEGRVRVDVIDNGVGIPRENLTRIFSNGFTTKLDGHGFGLHRSALAAKEMGGALTAHSDGPGRGATFMLDLPFKPPEVQA